jgi:hypothetical protein
MTPVSDDIVVAEFDVANSTVPQEIERLLSTCGATGGGALDAVPPAANSPRKPARHSTLLIGSLSPTSAHSGIKAYLHGDSGPARGAAYSPVEDWVVKDPGTPIGTPWHHSLLYVLTWPAPGRAAEYNDWYSTVHIHQVVAVPGFAAARRYRPVPGLEQPATGHYLALYVIDGELGATLDRLSTARADGTLEMSDSLDHSESYPYAPVS